MAAANWFRYLQRAYLSNPKHVRQLLRLPGQCSICRVVEVGISELERTLQLIEIAQRYANQCGVSYTGIDWFDARPATLGRLGVKDAYCRLRTSGARIRLVPGMPGLSLAASANAHQGTDLLLFGLTVDDAELERAWFYVPRMLHRATVVLRETRDANGREHYRKLEHAAIEALASQGPLRKAA